MSRNGMEYGADHDTEYEEKTNRAIERFADKLAGEHPNLAAAMAQAHEGKTDYREMPWLDPRQEGAEHNGARMMKMIRDIVKHEDDPAAKREAMTYVTDLMIQPLEKGIVAAAQKEERAVLDAASPELREKMINFRADREDWTPEISALSRSMENAGETAMMMKYSLTASKIGLFHRLENTRDLDIEAHAERLASTAEDLSKVMDGRNGNKQLHESLAEMDPGVHQQLNWRNPTVPPREEHILLGPGRADNAEERAQLIFDAFQESMQGFSSHYQNINASQIAYGITARTCVDDLNDHSRREGTQTEENEEIRRRMYGRVAGGNPDRGGAREMIKDGLQENDPEKFMSGIRARQRNGVGGGENPERGAGAEETGRRRRIGPAKRDTRNGAARPGWTKPERPRPSAPGGKNETPTPPDETGGVLYTRPETSINRKTHEIRNEEQPE